MVDYIINDKIELGSDVGFPLPTEEVAESMCRANESIRQYAFFKSDLNLWGELGPTNVSTICGNFLVRELTKNNLMRAKHPHEKGYPDIIPMYMFEDLRNSGEKGCSHGVELKTSNENEPGWSAHHNENKNLLGFVWLRNGGNILVPKIAIAVYAHDLSEDSWTKLKEQKEGDVTRATRSCNLRAGVPLQVVALIDDNNIREYMDGHKKLRDALKRDQKYLRNVSFADPVDKQKKKIN